MKLFKIIFFFSILFSSLPGLATQFISVYISNHSAYIISGSKAASENEPLILLYTNTNCTSLLQDTLPCRSWFSSNSPEKLIQTIIKLFEHTENFNIIKSRLSKAEKSKEKIKLFFHFSESKSTLEKPVALDFLRKKIENKNNIKLCGASLSEIEGVSFLLSQPELSIIDCISGLFKIIMGIVFEHKFTNSETIFDSISYVNLERLGARIPKTTTDHPYDKTYFEFEEAICYVLKDIQIYKQKNLSANVYRATSDIERCVVMKYLLRLWQTTMKYEQKKIIENDINHEPYAILKLNSSIVGENAENLFGNNIDLHTYLFDDEFMEELYNSLNYFNHKENVKLSCNDIKNKIKTDLLSLKIPVISLTNMLDHLHSASMNYSQ